MNILLITIDALRADHVGYYGYKRKTSPAIDKLAKQSIVFKNAFSNGPFTPAAFPSILASVYPLQYGNYTPLPKQATLVSEVLKKAKYKTAGFHSNPYLSKFNPANPLLRCRNTLIPVK